MANEPIGLRKIRHIEIGDINDIDKKQLAYNTNTGDLGYKDEAGNIQAYTKKTGDAEFKSLKMDDGAGTGTIAADDTLIMTTTPGGQLIVHSDGTVEAPNASTIAIDASLNHRTLVTKEYINNTTGTVTAITSSGNNSFINSLVDVAGVSIGSGDGPDVVGVGTGTPTIIIKGEAPLYVVNRTGTDQPLVAGAFIYRDASSYNYGAVYDNTPATRLDDNINKQYVGRLGKTTASVVNTMSVLADIIVDHIPFKEGGGEAWTLVYDGPWVGIDDFSDGVFMGFAKTHSDMPFYSCTYRVTTDNASIVISSEYNHLLRDGFGLGNSLVVKILSHYSDGTGINDIGYNGTMFELPNDPDNESHYLVIQSPNKPNVKIETLSISGATIVSPSVINAEIHDMYVNNNAVGVVGGNSLDNTIATKKYVDDSASDGSTASDDEIVLGTTGTGTKGSRFKVDQTDTSEIKLRPFHGSSFVSSRFIGDRHTFLEFNGNGGTIGNFGIYNTGSASPAQPVFWMNGADNSITVPQLTDTIIDGESTGQSLVTRKWVEGGHGSAGAVPNINIADGSGSWVSTGLKISNDTNLQIIEPVSESDGIAIKTGSGVSLYLDTNNNGYDRFIVWTGSTPIKSFEVDYDGKAIVPRSDQLNVDPGPKELITKEYAEANYTESGAPSLGAVLITNVSNGSGGWMESNLKISPTGGLTLQNKNIGGDMHLVTSGHVYLGHSVAGNDKDVLLSRDITNTSDDLAVASKKYVDDRRVVTPYSHPQLSLSTNEVISIQVFVTCSIGDTIVVSSTDAAYSGSTDWVVLDAIITATNTISFRVMSLSTQDIVRNVQITIFK